MDRIFRIDLILSILSILFEFVVNYESGHTARFACKSYG